MRRTNLNIKDEDIDIESFRFLFLCIIVFIKYFRSSKCFSFFKVYLIVFLEAGFISEIIIVIIIFIKNLPVSNSFFLCCVIV